LAERTYAPPKRKENIIDNQIVIFELSSEHFCVDIATVQSIIKI
jgi:chemotaxis signal transduction protein